MHGRARILGARRRWGGNFYWDPNSNEPDDGATVLEPISNPTKGRWRRSAEWSMNVKAFGARGRAGTADTEALRKAIRHANAAGGGIVLLPPGIYEFDDTLIFDDFQLVHVMGVGGVAYHGLGVTSQLLYNGVSSPSISMKSCAGVTFQNVQLFCRNAGFTGKLVEFGHSMTGADSQMCNFKDCWLSAPPTANTLIDVSRMINTSFCGCVFSTVRKLRSITTVMQIQSKSRTARLEGRKRFRSGRRVKLG